MRKARDPSDHVAAASNAAANFGDIFDHQTSDRMAATALKQIAIQLILIRGELAALRMSIENRQSESSVLERQLRQTSMNPKLAKVR